MRAIHPFLLALLLGTAPLAHAGQAPSHEEAVRARISALAAKAIGAPGRFMLISAPAGFDHRAVAEQLAGILDDLRQPWGVTLVIGSDDTAGIARGTEAAFATVAPGRLVGCFVVFVGARRDAAAVGQTVKAAGASYQFVEYTP